MERDKKKEKWEKLKIKKWFLIHQPNQLKK